MPRKKQVRHKKVLAKDPVYGDTRITRLVSIIMRAGKKSLAERIVYELVDLLKEKSKAVEGPAKGNAMSLFTQALENVKPVIEVKSRRVGGSTYQVPVEVRPERRESLGLRWIIDAAKERNEKSMAEKLCAEFLDAYARRGGAIKKKEDVHRMAEANKAFAHYRW